MNIIKIKNIITANIYLVVGIGVSLFSLIFLLFPAASSIPSLINEISSQKRSLIEAKSKYDQLNKLIINQSALKTNLYLVDTALPSKENVPLLMTQVQRIATDSGVALRALQFGSGSLITSPTGSGKMSGDKNLKKVSLQIIIEGTFSNLQSFLRNLEKSSRIVAVDNIVFESKKGKDMISATVILSSYYIDAIDKSSLADLGEAQLKKVIEQLKYLKIYESEVTFSGVGKANPFE